MGQLTAVSIKAALKAPGRYSDGDGLILQVGTGGAASWVLRVQKDRRRRDIGLGSFKKVSLSLARIRAAEARTDIETGIDPVAKRKRLIGIPSFREAAAQFIAEREGQWRNSKHRSQWTSTLETYAYPKIGDQPVSEISGPAMREALLPIWLVKPETARRVLQRMGSVLDWACSKGFRDTEAPTRSVAKGLPPQNQKAEHFAAMPYADVPVFVNRLRERETWGRLALETLLLTAVRSGEVRQATWDEVDLEAKTWTIPASRMKAKREHVIPLSPAVVAAFRRAAELRTAGHKFIFHGATRDKPMSDMTLTKVLRCMEIDATVHGFRSSFRDWVSEETHFSEALAEAALAHAVKDKTEAAYKRGTLLAKRRDLMEAWAGYCTGESATVVRLVS